MDIHRCRFVPYPASAINALAFSHASNPPPKGGRPSTLRLAIGRANGDIEIWNPLKGAWFQETILRGGKDRTIEGLAWIQDREDLDERGYKTPGRLRLFSIGYSQAVTEWDLLAGKPLRHSAANYGEIWCMAVQPRDVAVGITKSTDQDDRRALEHQAQTQSQSIAVGCADGSIVLLSTAEDDLRFTKVLARPSKERARVLSVTFQNRHTIIAGHADSTIRIYEMRGGQQIRNMTLGGGPKGGPKESLVWSVKCLGDGTIVSGDSTGTISFWDGKHYALTQRIHGHEADVLDIAVSADGRSVFSGGMDRRTVLFQKSGDGVPGKITRWAKVTHHRLHQNDVKAMATFETKGMSVLASGGLDTNPVITPVQQFGKEHHRTLSSLPQQPPLSSAPRRRLVLSWWNREFAVWLIPQSSESPEANSTNQDVFGRKLVAKVVLQGDESITSGDLAADGTLIAVSTTAEIKLFKLRPKNGLLKVVKVHLPAEIAKTGAKLIRLSPDRRWLLAITCEDKVHLHILVDRSVSEGGLQLLPKIIRLSRLPREPPATKFQDGYLGNYDRSIIRVAFSSDSRILVSGDLFGYLDSWVLEGHRDPTREEDADSNSDRESSSDASDSDEETHPKLVFGQHWIRNPVASLIPKLRNAPLVLSFRPSLFPTSSAAHNGNTTLHPTRHNPHPHSHDLPAGEDRLLVLTAENGVIEFNVLAGRITEWSRRNPTSVFPRDFQNVRDQAKGVVWDIRGHTERIWVYGVNWLWMFDLSQDLPPLQDDHEKAQVFNAAKNPRQKKRKRIAEDAGEYTDRSQRRDTGAGSAAPDSELNMGISGKIWKLDGVHAHDRKLIDSAPGQESGSDEEGDYVSATSMTLVSLRRGVPDNVDMKGDINEQTSIQKDGQMAKMSQDNRPPSWRTYKYRPILGIVPLSGCNRPEDENHEDGTRMGEDGTNPRGIEVALVERPLWDMDLAPRFHGDQEWNQ